MQDDRLVVGRVLFLGAHCDDIEIGCGGTAAKLAAKRQPIAFATATLPNDEVQAGIRRAEASRAAALLGLSEAEHNLFFGAFPDGDLNQKHKELRGWLKRLSEEVKPDTVFVHRIDEHSDHEALSEVSKGVFADKNVFLYYIPRQAPDLPFEANCAVAMSEFIGTKVAMCQCHVSQPGIYVDPDSVRTNAHNCYIRWYGAKEMRKDGFAEDFALRSWRSALSVSVTPEGMPDELRLVRSSNGTFLWSD